MDQWKQSGRESEAVWLDNTGLTVILIIKPTPASEIFDDRLIIYDHVCIVSLTESLQGGRAGQSG